MIPNYDSEKNTLNKIRLSLQFSKNLVLDLESSIKLLVTDLDKRLSSKIVIVDKTVSTILDSSTILGSVTDLTNSGKFSILDNTKIYNTLNNIKLINYDTLPTLVGRVSYQVNHKIL